MNNPPANNSYPNTVIISLAPNCPSEAAQYARLLAYYLQQNGVNMVTTGNVNFSFDSQEARQQIDNFMTQAPIPHVFINGRAMGRPSYDEIIQEIQYQRNARYGFD
jgi:glutaredoxin-related protein